MSPQIATKKYRISGLDCANCANQIEGAIRKMDGMEHASVSFATETVHIPESEPGTLDRDTLDRIMAVIRKVEPEAQLVIPGDGTPGEEVPGDERGAITPGGGLFWASNRLRILRFSAALLLVIGGVLFRGVLQTTPYRWAEYAVFLTAYLLSGGPVVYGALRNIVRGRVFDEMFLMTVATVGAIAIHELAEAVGVMLFYSVGEFFQDLAVDRSRRSISALMDLRPDFARIILPEGAGSEDTGGESSRIVDPEAVEVGAVIEVFPGERIPLDGEVIDGESAVDTSALTGESVPRTVAAGDGVLAGFINDSGKIRISVGSIYSESAVARVLELVETASSRKAPTEQFISRFAAVYTPVMVGLAAALAFLPPLFIPGASLSEWVYRALVLLVISCPCALVISIPLGYFGGIGAAARRHILVKGANYLDALKNVSTVVFDKTGTLTRGVFKVTATEGVNGFSGDDVLGWAAAAETYSTHPIARSIRAAFEGASAGDTGGAGNTAAAENVVGDVREEKGYGISATVDGRRVVAGSSRLLDREGVERGGSTPGEGTVVHVAVDGVYAGYVLISDEIKPEAHRVGPALRELGISRTVMLTGDNRRIAEGVAARLGLDEVRAELLPQDKVSVVEELKRGLPAGEQLAFVGDGINDAPVLMQADVGIAMGDLGSDAAIEAADVVIMDDRLDRVPEAIGIARFTRKIVIQNIIFALGVKAAFLALGAFGVATMWEAVIADVGVALLAVLNATRTLAWKPRSIPESVLGQAHHQTR